MTDYKIQTECKYECVWDTDKPVSYNLKKNKLQAVFYGHSRLFESWKDPLLEKYMKNVLVGGGQRTELKLYDDDVCAFFTPFSPRCCIRTPILDDTDFTIDLKVSFTEELNTKFLFVRNKADIEVNTPDILQLQMIDKDIVSCVGDTITTLYSSIDLYEPYEFTIKKQGNTITINSYNLDLKMDPEYWINIGLISEKGDENAIHLYDLKIQTE